MGGQAKFRVPTKAMDIGMASIKNVSGGGLCLLTNDDLENGQIIQVEFKLTKDKINIIAMCEVVWVETMAEENVPFKFQVGIKFIEIDKSQQDEITNFVISRLKNRIKKELEKEQPKPGKERYTLLVVDDDKVTLSLISNVFGDEFNVITASDGHDGVQKALEWQPDLILLDIIMPDMDGFSTLLLLKDIEETKDIPVIMLSVVREKSKIFQAIREGATDFILKPFTAENLHVKIQKTIFGN